jgi:hypothetical protein
VDREAEPDFAIGEDRGGRHADVAAGAVASEQAGEDRDRRGRTGPGRGVPLADPATAREDYEEHDGAHAASMAAGGAAFRGRSATSGR